MGGCCGWWCAGGSGGCSQRKGDGLALRNKKKKPAAVRIKSRAGLCVSAEERVVAVVVVGGRFEKGKTRLGGTGGEGVSFFSTGGEWM